MTIDIKEKSFGDLIREKRIEYGLQSAQLAYQAGVNQSTVSRLESGSSSPTLATTMRICKVLDVGLEKVISHFVNEMDSSGVEIEALDEDGLGKLKLPDLLNFQLLIRENPERCFGLLSEIINLAVDIRNFISPGQLQLSHSSIVVDFNSVVNYPGKVPSSLLRNTLLSGGAMLPSDAEALLKALRLERDLKFNELGQRTAVPVGLLIRMENGPTDRTRLTTLFDLEKAFEGELVFQAFWSAYTAYNELLKDYFSSNKQEKRDLIQGEYQIIVQLMKAYRWLQIADDGRLENWLSAFRENVSNVPAQ